MLQDLNAQFDVEVNVPVQVDTNLAVGMDDDQLIKIGREAVDGFNHDLDSRSEWESRNEEWFKLAAQIYEKKSFPWAGAANVKYPLLTTAVNSFAARAYPALVTGPNLVRGIVIGADRMGIAMEKAIRIGKHMSYQLLYQMEDWEDGQDKLCVVVALVGNCFKKTYYDTRLKQNVSEVVLPKDLVVNYYAKSVESAPRKTHILPYGQNDVVEMTRSGYFRDVEYGQPTMSEKHQELTEIQGIEAPQHDNTTPYEFLEQHTYLDVDEDGYAEPVIITVERNSQRVARISKRYEDDAIERNDTNEIVRIEAEETFTNYIFFPDPQSGIYGFGYGNTIGPINEAANTLMNQLIDAGSMSTLGGGWIAKGTKMKAGDTKFRPNEWKMAQMSGDDLRKSIVPLPTKEPSNVLFTLFETMISSGERLASVTEISSGQTPGQNTPASVVMTAVDQGSKVFNAVYKRLHRAFTKELRKLFALNGKHLPEREYFTPLEGQQSGQTQATQPELVYRGDYDKGMIDVIPTADPTIASDAQKMAKAQNLMGLVQLGTVNPQEVTKRVLDAMNEPNIPALLQMPPPQPDQEIELKKMQMQLEHQREMFKLQIEMKKAEDSGQKDLAKSIETLQKAENLAQENLHAPTNLHLATVDRMHQGASLMLQKEKQAQEAKQNAQAGSSGMA